MENSAITLLGLHEVTGKELLSSSKSPDYLARRYVTYLETAIRIASEHSGEQISMGQIRIYDLKLAEKGKIFRVPFTTPDGICLPPFFARDQNHNIIPGLPIIGQNYLEKITELVEVQEYRRKILVREAPAQDFRAINQRIADLSELVSPLILTVKRESSRKLVA